MSSRFTISPEDFVEFCKKVLRLRAEGLSDNTIASRFGVARTTIVQRMKRYREMVRGE